MILKKIDELKGGEILAKSVMTWDYQIILSQGSVLKKEYVDRIAEFGVFYVYVEEESEDKEVSHFKLSIENSVKQKVREILERHTYQNANELRELSRAADNIISNIIEEDRIVKRIFEIKERSADVYEHSINVTMLSIFMALKLKVDKKKIHDIGVGCLLHDIGLRYTTVEYNNRSIDSFHKQEKAEYKKHPIFGYTALKEEGWISELSKVIILYHHEQLDGLGYPLRTADIPFECKIVNVCDTFDEMICGIGYERIKAHQAMEYLKNNKNKLFDKKITETFLSFIEN